MKKGGEKSVARSGGAVFKGRGVYKISTKKKKKNWEAKKGRGGRAN